jgi:hypothetical protein
LSIHGRLAAGIAGVIAASLGPLWCSPAQAQVNTEVLRKRIKDRGFTFILEGTFDGHTGNTQGLSADGLIGGGFSAGVHRVFAFASADYTRLNGTVGVDKSFAHLRYDDTLSPFVWWEVFAQAQSDQLQALQIRNLFGTGPRYGLYQDKWLGLFLGAACMLEHDAYDEPVGADLAVTFYMRASAYVAATATLSDGIQVVTTTYLQPRIGLARDIRVESESGFVFKVSKALSTSITLTAHYNSNPPPGVLPTDTELKNVLMLAL